jgi:hypothetical protein
MIRRSRRSPARTLVADAAEETVTATTSGLKYDVLADQSIYTWKSSTTIARTGQRRQVKPVDGASHYAFSNFPNNQRLVTRSNPPRAVVARDQIAILPVSIGRAPMPRLDLGLPAMACVCTIATSPFDVLNGCNERFA